MASSNPIKKKNVTPNQKVTSFKNPFKVQLHMYNKELAANQKLKQEKRNLSRRLEETQAKLHQALAEFEATKTMLRAEEIAHEKSRKTLLYQSKTSAVYAKIHKIIESHPPFNRGKALPLLFRRPTAGRL